MTPNINYPEMKQSVIYKIESVLNPNKIYIGSAAYFSNRKSRHLQDLRLNKHPNRKLQNHYNKYGENDLIFSVIEPCFPQFLTIREQYYIDTLNPWFNICKIAGNTLGRECSEETKRKMSGRIPWNKGKKLAPFTEEAKHNMSVSHKGNPGYWKDKTFSLEAKENMSKARKRDGTKPPSWLNKHHSEESKQKMSHERTLFYKRKREKSA